MVALLTFSDDYEPPNFRAVEGDVAGHFASKPFSMDIGSVDTNHHDVSLKVCTLSSQEVLPLNMAGPQMEYTCIRTRHVRGAWLGAITCMRA